MASKNHNTRFNELLDELRVLHGKKNHDYAADEDPLSNFRMCEAMDIPAWKGAVVRLGDKFARVQNFARHECLMVKDETVQDTLMDLAAYALLTLQLYEEMELRQVDAALSAD